MSAARRTTIQVTWESVDISRDLAPHLLGLTYTDNLTGAADDLSLEFQDRDGLWSGDWQPTFGDTVEVVVSVEPGEAWLTGVEQLRLGTFAHDKISLSGPPRRASIKAVTAPLATGLRRHKRTHAWNGISLFDIAGQIADRADCDLDWIGGGDGMKYGHRVQKDKSDLEFLEEACTEIGKCLKVDESAQNPGRFAIIIFGAEDRDGEPAVGDISLSSGRVLGWTFDSDDSARYGSAHIKFFDPRTGKVTEAEFPPTGTSADARRAMGLDPDGQSLEVRIPVEDKGRAETICKGKLRAANRFANTGRLTVMGDPGLVAGVTFNLTDAGGFNGKFIVTKATHNTTGGYTCALDVRRCVEGL